MISILRKNQRVTMLFVAILTIVAFIFLYNTSQLEELANTRNMKIYGQTLSPGALDRQARNYQLTIALAQYDLLQKLGGAGADRDESLSEFVWNLLVLQHQARALGIEPTDVQVLDRIKSLPSFQTNGQFDREKYATFLRDQLAPRGMSERHLEDVMKDSLRVERVSQIVEAPIGIGDAEMRDAARVLQGVTGGYVKFDASEFAKNISITPEEITAYYERNQASFQTEEIRAVRFVAFELPGGTQPEGRERVEALQKQANDASNLSDGLAAPGASFEGVVKAAGRVVRSTPAFSRSGEIPAAALVGGEMAKEIATVTRALAPTAFLLREVGKTSDVVQIGDVFYVVELSELLPSRAQTLEEATPTISARLTQIAAEKVLREEAANRIAAIREALAAGRTFEEATKGLTVGKLDNVAPMSPTLSQEDRVVLAATVSLREGEVSRAQPAEWGLFAVHLQSRSPLDEKELETHRAEIQQALLQNKQGLLFAEWLRIAREEAGILVPKDPRG